MTKLSENDFSLDDDDQDESLALLANARQSVNLPAIATRPEKTTTKKKAKKGATPRTTEAQSHSNIARGSVNFLNSDKWPKDLRPPHLEDDEVFNTLSVEAAANHIMQWMTTKAMMASNEHKEKRSRSMAGREKPDEPIKKVKVEAGEDDALSIFHFKRFKLRTPLTDPKDYWHLMPIKWPEVNKSLYLENIGMDNICSPKTLEMLHDRSSPIEIKMFLTMNINVGRSGVAKKTESPNFRRWHN